MATTVQDVVNRAKKMAVTNTSAELTNDSAEMIFQVQSFENELYQAAARAGRYFYSSSTVASSAGAANRTVAIPATAERLVHVFLSGTPETLYSRVDREDPDAELAPRFYVEGQTITEVSSDWGSTGSKSIVVGFAQAPAALTITGALTQTVSTPDRHADFLAIRLAEYLVRKDVGNDPSLIQSLKARGDERLGEILESLAHYPGVARRRFISPEPLPPGSN